MITAHAQPAAATLPPRLRERLTALGLGAVRLGPTGQAQPITSLSWIENTVIGSAPFAAAVRRHWPELTTRAGELVAVWPGLSLAPLHAAPRRFGRDGGEQAVAAAIVQGPDFADAEQFRSVCDAQQVDAAVARQRVDPRRLVGDAEAKRLAAALGWMHQDTVDVDRRLGELQHMSQELADSYEELSLLYKFSTSMTVNQSPATFMGEACSELQQCVGLRWLALQLSDREPRLQELAGQMVTAGPIDAESADVRRIGDELLDAYRGKDQSVIINDPARFPVAELEAHARSLLVVPLHKNGELLGVLFGADKLDGVEISSVDSKLCDSLSNSLTIFLENMMLYEDIQAMFLGTLHALTAAIDAKDSYTHGHSERVAMMSRELAVAAGLDEHTVERVYLSGLVHDVGKIGVPEAVLCKPGKLTDHEFELIKMHPRIGGRILSDIAQMKDLVPGVLYHHERWDGRGYPHGLAGEEIPLFGRVIGLADAFDAMSSTRTYRSAMDAAEALREIERCKSKQFDPELADVFVDLDFTTYHEMIRRHLDHPHDQTPARHWG